MARTKTFTLESALDQALIVFRQHGYHNTSMRMISDRLGLFAQQYLRHLP